MNIETHSSPQAANAAAADRLANWLSKPSTRNVMVASGNTPIELYRLIAEKRLPLAHLHVFALDEYVGVPSDEPRTCAGQLFECVVKAWRIPAMQFYRVSPVRERALASVQTHERRIAERGGLDVIILGLGQNGHLGFNEPGSAEDSPGRIVDLQPITIEANRKWFGGNYAPTQGATVGLKTILAARRVMILAYGPHKAAAAAAMVRGPRVDACPASLLQGHPEVWAYFDTQAL